MIRKLKALPTISLAGLESVSGRCRALRDAPPSARTVAAVVRLIGARSAIDIGAGHGHTLHAACAAMRGGGRAVAVDLPTGDARSTTPDANLATVAAVAGYAFKLARADADEFDIIPVAAQIVVVDSDDAIEVPVLRAIESDALAMVVPDLGRVGRRERALDGLSGSGYWAAVAADADALIAVRWAARWLRGRKL